MKNNFTYQGVVLSFLLFISTFSFAKQFTSVANGNWNSNATWGTPIAPGATDTVTITNGHTVTVSAVATINKVTINAGGILKLNRNLTVSKIIINNGSLTGGRSLFLNGTGIVISGTGIYTGHTGTIQFNKTPQTIDAGVVIQQNTGNLILNNNATPGITITNNGQIILKGGNTVRTNTNTKLSTFTMGINAVLTVSAATLNNARATLNASANGCAVNYFGGAYNIKIPSGGKYYDMSVDAGTKTNSANLIMHSLTVAAASTFRVAGFNMTLSGNWTNNGTIQTNTGIATFNGAAAQTIIDASGNALFATLIMSGTNNLNFANNVTATSNFTITSGTVDATLANSNLTVGGNFTNNSTFTARKGTVTLNGAGAQALGGTSSTSFYNLTLNGATVTLGNSETATNTLLISTGTLDVSASNYSLTVGQNFTNNAAFTARNGKVTLTGNTSTPLNINGTASTTFYSLTTNPANVTDVVLLGIGTTVNDSLTISKGTFNSQNFQITGNAAGKLTMAASTSLLLGLPTVATNILFPTNFVAASIKLNATSTVTYQANIAQNISTVPTYGNVVVTNGNANVIKTPTATPLNIAGNLTITKGAGTLTLSQTINSINLTGNFTSNGVLSFTTGNMNVGGNFINNGTFTAGNSTLTLNGSSPQTLGGTTASTFHLLTINNSGPSTITLGNNETVNSIFTITSGAFDVSASNYSLTVGGNFLNSGSFNARNGTVTLNGALNQSIGGTSLTPFYNLTLSGKTITMNHNESLQSVITINSGALNGPDSLTMISTAALTARIAPVAAGSTIGAGFIVQRYITGNKANFQGLASPVKASILKDWDYNPGFYMSGVTGNDGNAVQNGHIYYSVYTYNETKDRYDSVNTDNQPLTPGLGIYLWMGNSLSSFSPITFSTHGIPNVGNVNYTVTKNNKGNNLIGNPYASPLQWTTFQVANNLHIGGIFYVFDETTGNWENSNGVTGSGGRLVANPNIIPAHQGFMVTATSTGVITFKEVHKSNTDAQLIRLADPSDMVRIALTTNANTYSGHAMVQFSNSASENYLAGEDALYIKSHLDNVPVIYSLSADGEHLSNTTVPQTASTNDIILYAGGGDEGLYTLTFTNINNLTKYNCIQLEDVKSGKWTQINEGTAYSYTEQQGQMYKFILHFKALQPNENCNVPESTVTSEQNSLAGVDIFSAQTGAQVRFSFSETQEVNIAVYNTLGQEIGQAIQCNVMDNTVEVPLPATHDIYIILVQTPYGVQDKRIYR